MSNPVDPPDTSQATVAWGDDPKMCPSCGKTFGREVAFCPDDGTALEWLPGHEEDAAAGAPETAAAADRPAEEDALVGQVLRDKWKILEKLGAGSFGSVYKVQDIKGGWIEALKILGVDRLTGAEAEEARKRFLREARIMKRLGTESPHIVGLSTYEEDLEAGLVYFTMEHVEGESLGDLLEREGPLGVERLLPLAVQVCDALSVAHEGPEGVVHRDLKLENVMVTRDRHGDEIAKVLDFGIAKIAEREADSRLTTVGTLGTPGFAAPEQLRAEEVDNRTDLFALGVILYSLLTGRDPWLGHPAAEGTSQIYELMVASDRGEVRPMEETGVEVPAAMQGVVLKLLRRDPAERYQSAAEVKDALQRLAEGGAEADTASLRVLTDAPGVRVRIRSGRTTVSEGRTPCTANGLAPGSYRVAAVDPRFEPVETVCTLAAGDMSDVTLVTTPRRSGAGGLLARHRGVAAAALVLLLGAAAAVVVAPWGTRASLDELTGDPSAARDVRVTGDGIMGRLERGFLPPVVFTVPMDEDAMPAAVEELRAAGVDVDASWLARRLLERARTAQREARYFGPGADDVEDLAARLAALEEGSDEARSLLLKAATRMAWDADAAEADGDAERARELRAGCARLAPDFGGCAGDAGA